MDKCNSDAEFDSYWDYEAKNKNRNRIRVGRQYQATIPPLLKPGQKDGRKSEELETLKWKPDQLTDQQIEEYLSMAKGIRLFSKSLDNPPKPAEKSDNSLQSAIKGLSEFVTSHHPCHHDDGCKVARPTSVGESSSSKCSVAAASDWTSSEIELFSQAFEACGKNFSAIKKEYLPWKPIKSIIEYYYEGKSEKMEDDEITVDDEAPGDILPKREENTEETIEEKPNIKSEPEETSAPCPSAPEELSKEAINFLDSTRVTDPCQILPSELKMSVSGKDGVCPSSTVGSLKFFLGGRLVLKLNAQQDSGSGTKCQWVQSNDLPKHPNNLKRQRKKCIPESGLPVNHTVSHKSRRKADDSHPAPSRLSDCDPTCAKKPKLKSDGEGPDSNRQGLLLCSSSWTPPVADGQEVIEVDDASSKTSEGYISPVLSNSRHSKMDARTDCFADGDPPKGDADPYWTRSDLKACHGSAFENSDSASKAACRNSPNHVSDISPYKHEMLNHHKSALPHSKLSAKNLCYQPQASHSSSAFLKQLNKWSNVAAHYMRTSSPFSLASATALDLKVTPKENPLDLSSKQDQNSNDSVLRNSSTTQKSSKPTDSSAERAQPSECDSRPASSEFSPQSSTQGSLVHSVGSPFKDMAMNSHKCSEDIPMDCDRCLECSDSPDKESDSSSQLAYTCCNLPCQCALSKCTKDCSLGEVPLDLSSANEPTKEKSEAEDKKKDDNANSVSSDDTDVTGRGMLYQLLKNKTSK